MRLTDVRILPVELPIKTPFASAHEAVRNRQLTLVQLTTDTGLRAIGELEAFEKPAYNAEIQTFEREVLVQNLIPALKQAPVIESLNPAILWPQVNGHRMAKAAIEMALWSLRAQDTGVSLAELLAQEADDTVQPALPVGISLGLAELKVLKEEVSAAVSAGYQRVKIKVEDVSDLAKIGAVRTAFPQLPLIVDGNGAFHLNDVGVLQRLAGLDILMLEQPLSLGDFEGHAQLQRQLPFAVCLDEDILTVNDLRLAQLLGSAEAINLKPARVGGFTESLKILRLCRNADLTCWIGGMVESDIGRYYSQSLASLSWFKIPGDVGPAEQFYSDTLSDWRPRFADGGLRLSEEPPRLSARYAQLMEAQPNLLK